MKCLECHGIGQPKLDSRCLECHVEIEWLRSRERGLHGIDGLDECATCHQEHGGRDFEIVHWGPGGRSEFDHRRAGWELVDGHDGVECQRCHRDELRSSSVMSILPGGREGSTWLGLEVACASCHADPHEGRLGSSCAECHTEHDFRTIVDNSFDHDRTQYPLRGAHRRVNCARCHAGESGWVGRPAFTECASCHADPHDGLATVGGRAAGCATCHGVDRFRPSGFTVTMHTGPFALDGKHASVACAACHRDPRDDSLRLRMPHSRCNDCHADPHGAQLAERASGGACGACHAVDGFAPSTFTIADHRDLKFPLVGSHARTSCRSCHGPDSAVPRPASTALGTADVLFEFADTDCRSCHFDPHQDRFASAGCLSCHDQRVFMPSHVDAAAHSGYAFPLEGAHAAIPCFECHRELERARPASTLVAAGSGSRLLFAIEARECRDCHDDPHGGQFAGRPGRDTCSACHGLDSFRPASRLDHDRNTDFPLEGAHAGTACAACHRATELADGSVITRYRPLSGRCEDCHGPTSPLLGTNR